MHYLLMIIGCVLGAAWYGEAANPKVLIIGIDGCRPDAMLQASTPVLDRLWQQGAFSMYAKTDSITVSGPAWTSILTGAWSAKHGVKNNKYQPNTRVPHFFKRLKEHQPKAQTASFVNWAPINNILAADDCDHVLGGKTDQEITEIVVEHLVKEDADAVFVQLDAIDGAGHKAGFGPHSAPYLAAIATADLQIGQMVAALQKRTTYKDEEWLVIVVSDHGGIKKGHGGNTPQEYTIVVILSGAKVPQGELTQSVNSVDVAVTALTHMGVVVDPAWQLDGKNLIPVSLK